MNMIEQMQTLIEELNVCCYAYYNKQQPLISDYEYDTKFDELVKLEKNTGVILSNSPTQNVGYEVKSELQEIKHSHAMLSLDKTKDVHNLIKFAANNDSILMHKLDGLTVLLTYENGSLVQAETRGNGERGEIITHNAKVFKNIPLAIPIKEHYEIEGEAIICYDDFKHINMGLPEESRYKNPRNLVSGSVRQYNSKIAAERNIKFIAWKVVKNDGLMIDNFKEAEKIGFTIVPYIPITKYDTVTDIEFYIDKLKHIAESTNYPIDGLVIAYNNIEYGLSLGQTAHHPKHSLAYKFYDEEITTTFRGIDWTMGKTGMLTPTAIFDSVEIDGTKVERASVHNLSILKKLNLLYGDSITVYKAHQIIPQIRENLTEHDESYCLIPDVCPICNAPTQIIKENDTEFVKCSNTNCKGKLLGKITHFVSKDAMDIQGLSEATLKVLIEANLIHNFNDIYNLFEFKDEIKTYEGFAEKKVNKLLESIENSKHNVKLEKFIYALSIPYIGKTASKTISKHFNGDYNSFKEFAYCRHNDWTFLDDIGDTLSDSLNNYFSITTNNNEMVKLAEMIDFEEVVNNQNENKNICLDGKAFCITGSLEIYSNRKSLIEDIEKYGGKVVSGVSKKTDYLLTNDTTSGSSKNIKAQALNIPIISEKEFKNMINLSNN